jgi:hypothetical protein
MRGQMVSPKANPAVEFNASKPMNGVYEALEAPRRPENIPEQAPDKQVLDYRQRAYEAAKAREAFNNRPQEGGTVMADQNIRTQGIRNAMDEKNMRWQAAEQMINEMNKDVPFFRQPEAPQMANFNRNNPMAEIPVEAPPVKVNKKFLK